MSTQNIKNTTPQTPTVVAPKSSKKQPKSDKQSKSKRVSKKNNPVLTDMQMQPQAPDQSQHQKEQQTNPLKRRKPSKKKENLKMRKEDFELVTSKRQSSQVEETPAAPQTSDTVKVSDCSVKRERKKKSTARKPSLSIASKSQSKNVVDDNFDGSNNHIAAAPEFKITATNNTNNNNNVLTQSPSIIEQQEEKTRAQMKNTPYYDVTTAMNQSNNKTSSDDPQQQQQQPPKKIDTTELNSNG